MQTLYLSNKDILNCCGCRACAQRCPVGAIKFIENEEGFIYPSIDTQQCISCGLCKNVCNMLQPVLYGEPQTGYAVYVKDRSLLRKSSSGGAFIALAKAVIADGGLVIGCVDDKDGMPMHTTAKTTEELAFMQGSKYAQSNMGTIYLETEKHLKEGVKVLFTGTPCQIAGLRAYLSKPYSNLYCMDIICHGVPSRKLYREYLKWLGKQKKGKVVSYQFRSKIKNNWSYTRRAEIKRRNNVIKISEMTASLDPYCYSFLRGFICRESCYKCPYSRIERIGDITVGDFWGIDKTYPELYNQDGVSAVIVNTAYGKELFEQVRDQLDVHPVEITKIQEHNGNLTAPTNRPTLRNHIYKEMNEYGFDRIANKYMRIRHYWFHYTKDKIPSKMRQNIKFILKQLIKNR